MVDIVETLKIVKLLRETRKGFSDDSKKVSDSRDNRGSWQKQH